MKIIGALKVDVKVSSKGHGRFEGLKSGKQITEFTEEFAGGYLGARSINGILQ